MAGFAPAQSWRGKALAALGRPDEARALGHDLARAIRPYLEEAGTS